MNIPPVSPQDALSFTEAQRYLATAEQKASGPANIPRDTPVRRISKVGIIGAGTMGGGIAMSFANSNIPVTVIDVNEQALERGLGRVRTNYELSATRGRLDLAVVEQRLALIKGSTHYESVADVDLIIESVFEDMALKRDVFSKLSAIARPDAILATNTSGLDVDEIARMTDRPESVIGLHFYSPANVMRLVEIVRGAHTSIAVIATSLALMRAMGKVPVVVGVCPGFVGNRMKRERDRQLEKLLLEGSLPWQVDKVVRDFGFPMGPFATRDMAGGIDVAWRARQALGVKVPVDDALHSAGRYGQKTGAGYYRYEEGSRTPIVDPKVERIIVDCAAELGIERRVIPDDEVIERLIYPMINEGTRILSEGIAVRSSDIDVIWNYGFGWPAYRGGPMYYADQVGLDIVIDRLSGFARSQLSQALEPSPLLKELAARGQKLRDWRQ